MRPCLHEIGDKVRLVQGKIDPDEPDAIEYGVVVATLWDAKHSWWDVWAVFYGFAPPTDQVHPDDTYRLRHFDRSLKMGWD